MSKYLAISGPRPSSPGRPARHSHRVSPGGFSSQRFLMYAAMASFSSTPSGLRSGVLARNSAAISTIERARWMRAEPSSSSNATLAPGSSSRARRTSAGIVIWPLLVTLAVYRMTGSIPYLR